MKSFSVIFLSLLINMGNYTYSPSEQASQKHKDTAIMADSLQEVVALKACEHRHLGGQSYNFLANESIGYTGSEYHLNDNISSLKVYEGFIAELYVRSNFGGGGWIIVVGPHTISDLKTVRNPGSPSQDMDDKISSLKTCVNKNNRWPSGVYVGLRGQSSNVGCR